MYVKWLLYDVYIYIYICMYIQYMCMYVWYDDVYTCIYVYWLVLSINRWCTTTQKSKMSNHVVPSDHQTWPWNIPHLKMIFLAVSLQIDGNCQPAMFDYRRVSPTMGIYLGFFLGYTSILTNCSTVSRMCLKPSVINKYGDVWWCMMYGRYLHLGYTGM